MRGVIINVKRLIIIQLLQHKTQLEMALIRVIYTKNRNHMNVTPCCINCD